MEFMTNVETMLIDLLGPFGPLIVVGMLGLLLVGLTLPVLMRKQADPLDKLHNITREPTVANPKSERLRTSSGKDKLEKYQKKAAAMGLNATMREALPSQVPLLAAGGIWSGADARRALKEGLDVVGLGRAAIAHPDWPQRVDEPGWQPAHPPYTRAFLASGGASEPLLDYLARRPGMIVEGVAAR